MTPRERSIAVDAVAARLHVIFGVCHDRAHVLARELVDAATAAVTAARPTRGPDA